MTQVLPCPRVAELVSVDLEELTRIVLDRAGISEYLLSPRRSRRREENHLYGRHALT